MLQSSISKRDIIFICLSRGWQRIRKPWKFDDKPTKEEDRKPPKPRPQGAKPAGAAKPPPTNQQQRRQAQGNTQRTQPSGLSYVTIIPTVEKAGALPLRPFGDLDPSLPASAPREATAVPPTGTGVAPLMNVRRSPRPGSVPPDRRLPNANYSSVAPAGHPPALAPATVSGPHAGPLQGTVAPLGHQASFARLQPGSTWTIIPPHSQPLLAPAAPQMLPP